MTLLYSKVFDVPDLQQTAVRLDEAVFFFLMKSGTIVQNDAKDNAPYETGQLKRSITTDNTGIHTGQIEIGSNLEYAKMRHYVNKKNPHTRYYLQRALEENESALNSLLDDLIEGALSKQ